LLYVIEVYEELGDFVMGIVDDVFPNRP
jgi:hypothetical protein